MARRPSRLTPEQRKDMSLYNRVRNLPDQLERARLRVKQLEREAERLGLKDLLNG